MAEAGVGAGTEAEVGSRADHLDVGGQPRGQGSEVRWVRAVVDHHWPHREVLGPEGCDGLHAPVRPVPVHDHDRERVTHSVILSWPRMAVARWGRVEGC